MSGQDRSQISEERLAQIQNVLGREPEDLISNWTEADEDGRTLTLFKYQDKIYPAFGDIAFGQLKDLTIRDDDVYIVGYPKTGCHWTFEVITMMLQGEAKLSLRNKQQTFVDVVNPTKLATLPSPRVLNSHVHFQDMPRQVVEKKTKMVLTIRNPKDTAASFYNHHRTIARYGYDGPFNKWFPLYLNGRGPTMRDHATVTVPGYKHNSLSRISLDLPREIQRLSEFLGISVTDSLVAGICDVTGIKKMKETFLKAGSKFSVRKGCHWTFEVLLMILQGEAKLSERNKLQTYVDVVNPTMLSTLPSPRVLNSHLLFQDMPKQLS
ncbi:sulfotransferase 6B1-like [Aplysia californica]|uniref:Sulfotransferase 6B1-like n=1 Tax=Aplysia californica TaxID=6500 RepID=A0ABM1VWV5_APLCA|nr:sulfotransferase 6B1-like [Aplysia californica]